MLSEPSLASSGVIRDFSFDLLVSSVISAVSLVLQPQVYYFIILIFHRAVFPTTVVAVLVC